MWAPVTAGVLLSLAGAVLLYAEFESELPHSLHNETEWLALASYVSARTHASSLPTRLGVLLALHALHIYACLPLLHLTKVLYGMWLGLVWGWLCCVAWELLLFDCTSIWLFCKKDLSIDITRAVYVLVSWCTFRGDSLGDAH